MTAKTIEMLQIKGIIQLKNNGESIRSIAKKLSISRNTVKDYLKIFANTGLTIPDLFALSDENLNALIFDPVADSKPQLKRLQDLEKVFSTIETELGKTGVTKELVWQEYKIQHPDGYSYSQFCHYLSRFLEQKQSVMHFMHKPGEKMEFDFAGKTMSFINNQGQTITCQIFVAILPFSGYTYIEAVLGQSGAELIRCLENALIYLGGVVVCMVTDNMKTCVKRPDRYEPELTDLITQFSLHYNTTVMPARVRKPRDKASVEKAVHLAYQRVFAPLRNENFNSLEELNAGIRKQLIGHHGRQFRNGDLGRGELFEQQEKPLLRSLPSSRLEIKRTVHAKVQKNYHVVLGKDWHYYSAPYQYTGKTVSIVYTDSLVEIYYEHKRIALHSRNCRKNGYTTIKEHMPENHLHFAETKGYDADYFRKKARKISPETAELIENILQTRFFYEQTYNACFGILKLADKYSPERLTRACAIALQAKAYSYRFINNILKNNTDKRGNELQGDLFTYSVHENLRDPNEYK